MTHSRTRAHLLDLRGRAIFQKKKMQARLEKEEEHLRAAQEMCRRAHEFPPEAVERHAKQLEFQEGYVRLWMAISKGDAAALEIHTRWEKVKTEMHNIDHQIWALSHKQGQLLKESNRIYEEEITGYGEGQIPAGGSSPQMREGGEE